MDYRLQRKHIGGVLPGDGLVTGKGYTFPFDDQWRKMPDDHYLHFDDQWKKMPDDHYLHFDDQWKKMPDDHYLHFDDQWRKIPNANYFHFGDPWRKIPNANYFHFDDPWRKIANPPRLPGPSTGLCKLKFVNFHMHENHTSHQTQGLSKKHLVVRRGKSFKITLMFEGWTWNPYNQKLVLEVCLGRLTQKIPVLFSMGQHVPQGWSAVIYPEGLCQQSVTIHIRSPALSSVALYRLLVWMEVRQYASMYIVGKFALLCNPWLKDDPVYMPTESHIQEYVKNDYGLIYVGTPENIQERPWLFGQYEPEVLEACLQLLQVSNEHLYDSHKDYILRADPVYLSRVICAMINCNDDLGVLLGRWTGNCRDGVNPTDWSGSAEILHQWLSSNYKPVRYGQCWVFASVLCTVLRVLGIPSRVVTVFNAAHDTDGNTTIEEYYTTSGEKVSMSKDSIWNFHVWVECWMKRPDLGKDFDGWQVVDPTPQERSGGSFRCGPCPVVAIKHVISVPFDTRFLYASVDGDVHRIILLNGKVVGKKVDSECVGKLIYTKSVGSDSPQNLTRSYKDTNSVHARTLSLGRTRCSTAAVHTQGSRSICYSSRAGRRFEDTSSSFTVSITTEGSLLLGENISMCVTVTNHSGFPRTLTQHINAQLKEYNSDPNESFWTNYKDVYLQPCQEMKLHHTIPHSQYESILKPDDLLNVAVVMQDTLTNERVMDAYEFNMKKHKITITIQGGDSIQMKREKMAQVTFMNPFSRSLLEVVLTVEGSGLLNRKQEAKLSQLQTGEKIEKKVSIMASSPGTKVLTATLSHSSSSIIISKSYHKVFVKPT